ncbi:hypothetical protein CVT24_004254 [Panaeolus cyanescens]|uniref:EthD domain-containing protein n=1 Tax=Panaeolus cyanescens TaxID=181874 RepID=A0A409VDC9_9AGAR|nr:hypothetical protein CVT24_004254 [Panaeolus cyanescens]
MRLAVFLLPRSYNKGHSHLLLALVVYTQTHATEQYVDLVVPMMSKAVTTLAQHASKEDGGLRLYTNSELEAIVWTFRERSEQQWTDLIQKVSIPDTTNWAIYDPLPDESIACGNLDLLSLPQSHIMVFNSMTPAAVNERDFNEWYGKEHIPLLSRAPTWLASQRYKLIDSNFQTPSYLALHFWGQEKAFDSAEYKDAINTPWKWKVVKHVLEKQRHVFHAVPSIGIDDH